MTETSPCLAQTLVLALDFQGCGKNALDGAMPVSKGWQCKPPGISVTDFGKRVREGG